MLIPSKDKKIKLSLDEDSFIAFLDWWKGQGLPTKVRFESVGGQKLDRFIVLENVTKTKKEKK